MIAHMPGEPANAQEWQTPSQAALQQRPCAQTADAHSPLATQAVPTAFSPQLPAWQVLGAAQSVSPVQFERQVALAAQA
jgi:hypothetical protein